MLPDVHRRRSPAVPLYGFCVQDAALRPEKFAEPGEKHPGRRAPQQVLVPQHDGAQRAGQEDRNYSGHREYARGGSAAKPVL